MPDTSTISRVSGKSWKPVKTATVRSHLQEGLKTKSWDLRMHKTMKEQAIRKLEADMRQEKLDERQRKQAETKERRLAMEEKKRLEEDKAKMGARKAARLRRREGRTKKINH